MIVEINASEMRDRLVAYSNCWSARGATVMAQWLADFAKDDAKFDAVSISCTFKEYDSIVAFAEEYFDDYKKFFSIREHDSSEFVDELILDWVGKRTILITYTGGGAIIKEMDVEFEHIK